MADKLTLREGGYYEARDGEVHGPLKYIKQGKYTYPFYIDYKGGCITWDEDGRYYYRNGHESVHDLIREVPAPAHVPATPETLPAMKHDADKLRFDLVPADAMALAVAVYTVGAAKYDDNNWTGIERERYRAARGRHENARLLGQVNDAQTKLPHIAHELTCLMIETALWARDTGFDIETLPGIVSEACARIREEKGASNVG